MGNYQSLVKMRRIILPDVIDADVPFYLSVEEWCAYNLPSDEYFFAWQVNPSIICGRHQEIDNEVNLEVAAKEGIKVWRRKSGGGAVLADMNNVMFSYITPSHAVQTSFDSYTGMICKMLNNMGIDAESTGRNDIAVNGHKVAGNSFLKLPGRSIVHGTMLYDTNFDMMGKVLTPSKAKMMSKGVVSVPSRVTTLKKLGINISCREFMEQALDFICPSTNHPVIINNEDLTEILKIRESYTDPDFLNFGKKAERKTSMRTYIEGVGELIFNYSLDRKGCISRLELNGDFLPLKDIPSHFTSRFIGCRPKLTELRTIINDINIREIITGLTEEKLISALSSLRN